MSSSETTPLHVYLKFLHKKKTKLVILCTCFLNEYCIKLITKTPKIFRFN